VVLYANAMRDLGGLNVGTRMPQGSQSHRSGQKDRPEGLDEETVRLRNSVWFVVHVKIVKRKLVANAFVKTWLL
jgi:hypothetical protein